MTSEYMHARNNQHHNNQSSATASIDAHSTKQDSTKLNWDTCNIPVIDVKKVLIDPNCSREDVHRNITHGFIVALPLGDPSVHNDDVNLFKDIVDQCDLWCLPLSLSRFVFVDNIPEIKNKLALYIRFTSREYAVMFRELSTLKFKIKINVKKIHIKQDMKGTKSLAKYTEQEMQELAELKLNGSKGTFHHYADAVIKIAESHPNNAFIQDNFAIFGKDDMMAGHSADRSLFERLAIKPIPQPKPHEDRHERKREKVNVVNGMDDRKHNHVDAVVDSCALERKLNHDHQEGCSIKNGGNENARWAEMQTQLKQIQNIDFTQLRKIVDSLVIENKMLKQRLSQYENR